LANIEIRLRITRHWERWSQSFSSQRLISNLENYLSFRAL